MFVERRLMHLFIKNVRSECCRTQTLDRDDKRKKKQSVTQNTHEPN